MAYLDEISSEPIKPNLHNITEPPFAANMPVTPSRMIS